MSIDTKTITPEPNQIYGSDTEGNPFEKQKRVKILAVSGPWVKYLIGYENGEFFSEHNYSTCRTDSLMLAYPILLP